MKMGERIMKGKIMDDYNRPSSPFVLSKLSLTVEAKIILIPDVVINVYK